MSVFVKCPDCNCIFPVHGFEREATCENCGTMFNPQTNPVLERPKIDEDGNPIND